MEGILIDPWMIDLASRTAQALETKAADEGLLRVKEQPHLQSACVEMARDLAAMREPAQIVSTQNKRTYVDWPRLGGVDVVICGGSGKVAVELKCGDDIVACAWAR
ncbi:MAG: hypothetical protein ABI927_08790 [Gaiellaceae bacterium]